MTTVRDTSPDPSRRPDRPGRILTWLALAAAVALLGHASWRAAQRGGEAWACANWLRTDFFLESAVPSLLLAPLFARSFQHGRALRYRSCALWQSWGVLGFGLLLLVPRGVYASGWFLVPVMILLVTCTFGATAGVLQAATVVLALLLSAASTHAIAVVGAGGVWVHAAMAGASVLAMALLGSLLQRTLELAIAAEEDQTSWIDEARRALRHRENLLRHAMRIDTVGEMASMVVHQLRNQFQLVMGHATLGANITDDERVVQHFRSIVETLERSNQILEGLLGMSRSEPGTVGRVDLVGLCSELSGRFARVLPAGIALELTAPGHSLWVDLDPQGLEHALLNLVLNARQAMDGRGQIRVRVSQPGEAARIEVEDTGHGIDPAILGQVFKPFFTTKPRGEGTGLGLAAVHRFVVSSRGRVWVASQPGVGTVFTLEFPLAGPTAVEDESRAG